MALDVNTALRRLDENPTIADTLLIDIECPGADGCFSTDPYKVDNVIIYYVGRSYGGTNFSSYDKNKYDPEIKQQLDDATAVACASPTEENLAEVTRLTSELSSSVQTDTFYYNEATPVAIIGTPDDPAWFSYDDAGSYIRHITIDEDGNTVYGRFEVEWTPLGMREGDYFVCWTWTPNLAGDSLSSHLHFNLGGSTLLTTSIPTHFTNPDKYSTLMERYLPEMFKLKISSADMTPLVLQEFGLAVAKGFTFLEDQANQIVDLIDANSTHESLLTYLGNLFNLKLRTSDPTLWRRQIKRAVPLNKKKGTYAGLEEALSQAGIKLTKLSRLWQVVSKYTYQEEFIYSGSNLFPLSHTALPMDPDNCEVYRRDADDENWDTLNYNSVKFNNDDDGNLTILNWIGLPLVAGDAIRVVYLINEVPSVGEQTIENYIRTLPLADARDERDQDYPIKNWNVRVIEEDDPLIDLVIPTRHPYYDPVVFGKVRTEFPYSENIYNMEEYNGSRRDSFDPCDIDKEFIDPCGSCLGSKFTVDLEIENLSTDRIVEAQEVIEEYMPFHAVLHSMNLTGAVNEIIQPPIESIDTLLSFSGSEFTISGNAQTIFNRSMEPASLFKRNELANVTTAISGASATGFNLAVTLFSHNINFEELPLDSDPDYTFLEVLSPSSNSGEFTVQNAVGNTVELETVSVSEPVDESAFTFRLSNERAVKTLATISKDNYMKFSDENIDFDRVKTEWDTANEPSLAPAPWQIYFSSYGTHEIQNILSDGTIVINDHASLPASNTSNIVYSILDENNEVMETSSSGRLTITKRGRVSFAGTVGVRGNNVTLDDVRSLMDSYHDNGRNHYVLYDGDQYEFDGFVDGSATEFYIKDWDSGDVAGVNSATLYQRLADTEIGYFHYKGMKLVTSTDYEVALTIQDGDNADSLYPAVDGSGNSYTLQLDNSNFKGNYLLLIGSDYYSISRIDGTTIYVVGPEKKWKTTGTALTFDALIYNKQSVSVDERLSPPMPGHEFEYIMRKNNEIIEADYPVSALAEVFNSGDDEIVEMMSLQEGISFSIKTKDGNTEEGEI